MAVPYEHAPQQQQQGDQPDAADRQARAHHGDRLLPAWSKSGQPNSGAHTVARIVIAAVGLLFVWQVAARTLGSDNNKYPVFWIHFVSERLAEYVGRFAAWLGSWMDFLRLWEWLMNLLKPLREEAINLGSAFLSIPFAIARSAIDGFMSVFPENGLALVVGCVGGLAALVIGLAVVESLGLSLATWLRPSFWFLSGANVLYEMSAVLTSVYCVGTRLIFEFRDTVMLILRRIPGFDHLMRVFSTALRYVLLSVKDIGVAIPKGFKAAVTWMFGKQKSIHSLLSDNVGEIGRNRIGRNREEAKEEEEPPKRSWYPIASVAVLTLMLVGVTVFCFRDGGALRPLLTSAIQAVRTVFFWPVSH